MEDSMSNIELLALVASVSSLILAVGAIWLSIVFFKMSNEASQATTKAAEGIDASVQRLENLFDKLYSDTFSMMKDTVSDMRKHIWNGDDSNDNVEEDNKNTILEEADKKAEEKIQEIKSAFDKQLNDILHKQKIADGKVSDIGSELEGLLENAIQTSRMVESEAREETVRQHILKELRLLRKQKRTVVASDIVTALEGFIPARRVIQELKSMKEDGALFIEDKSIAPDTKIRILNINERIMQKDKLIVS